MQKNITKLIILLTILINSAISLAQTPADNSLLWEISGKNIKKSSYLFGTIHAIPDADYFFTDKMKKTLDNTSVLMLEIEMDIPISKQIEIGKQMYLPDKKTLKDYMNPTDYQKIIQYLKTEKIPENRINAYTMFKPFFCYSFVLMDILGNVKTYEKELDAMAKKNHQKTIGLETIDQQMAVIEQISIEQQIRIFLSGTDSAAFNIRKDFDNMLQLYKQQNIDSLYQLLKIDDTFGNYQNLFIYDRNRQWLSEIEKQIGKQATFIAVGAGHLAGDNGLIALLRKNGYTVRPVNIEYKP